MSLFALLATVFVFADKLRYLPVPAYYALILRSLTVLEGLALYTDPNFKVLAASYPYFAKRLLTDQNPYLRNSLVELLFQDGVFRFSLTSVETRRFISSRMIAFLLQVRGGYEKNLSSY